jgi:hypothetical protein
MFSASLMLFATRSWCTPRVTKLLENRQSRRGKICIGTIEISFIIEKWHVPSTLVGTPLAALFLA